jgi:hypothetical protein
VGTMLMFWKVANPEWPESLVVGTPLKVSAI